MERGKGSLEETPTWAVSIVCLFFFLLSFMIDTGLHHLTKVQVLGCILYVVI
jgi:mlo protein